MDLAPRDAPRSPLSPGEPRIGPGRARKTDACRVRALVPSLGETLPGSTQAGGPCPPRSTHRADRASRPPGERLARTRRPLCRHVRAASPRIHARTASDTHLLRHPVSHCRDQDGSGRGSTPRRHPGDPGSGEPDRRHQGARMEQGGPRRLRLPRPQSLQFRHGLSARAPRIRRSLSRRVHPHFLPRQSPPPNLRAPPQHSPPRPRGRTHHGRPVETRPHRDHHGKVAGPPPLRSPPGQAHGPR